MSPLSFPRRRGSYKKVQAAAKAGQAAVELAVFGAILIFLLGTIIRSAFSNSYTQSQDFKLMRMAMLASWTGSKAQNISRSNASILFVEDRLSPDFNKYGDLDRDPFIAQGSGTFTYELLYPLSVGEPATNLPIMDVYVNGQHFPLTTAWYGSKTIVPPASCTYPPGSCAQNQCLRNQREWVGGIVTESQFNNVIPVTTLNQTQAAIDSEIAANDSAIFKALVDQGLVSTSNGTDTGPSGNINTTFTQLPSTFSIKDPTTDQTVQLTQQEISTLQSVLQGDQYSYKLFYTVVANSGPSGNTQFSPTPPPSCSGTNNALCSTATVLDASGNQYINTNGDMQYDLLRTGYYTPASCASAPSPSSCVSVETQFPCSGVNGPECSGTSASECSGVGGPGIMRCDIAWQWAATPGTSATSIGLNPSSAAYPTYDINGTLKEVTIYGIAQNPNGTPTVTYEDPSGGDMDLTWDSNTCGPKPGLQGDAQVFTFTKMSNTCQDGSACSVGNTCPDGTPCPQGTYLQIKEGKLYNPVNGNGTGQFVRSANQKDTIDLIQREIQLSNNTGRFCDLIDNKPTPCIGALCSTTTCANGDTCIIPACPDGTACTPGTTCPGTICVEGGHNSSCKPDNTICPANPCTDGSICSANTTNCPSTCADGSTNCLVCPANAEPNPVEVCVDGKTCNCFMNRVTNPGCGDTIKETCFDTSDNMLFVRSRLEDRRGHFWLTNTSGQLQVQ